VGANSDEAAVLVAYSEIALKSEPVRRRLERMLMDDIRFMVERRLSRRPLVSRSRGRIVVKCVDPEVAAVTCSKIFGVVKSMSALEANTDLESMVERSLRVAERALEPGDRFAVRASRAGSHPYTSQDVERRVGSEILERLSDRGLRVDLESPEETIHVEARERVAYVYHRVIEGVGGFPYGSQGRLVSLLSGGIDSPVAAWLMMRRGAAVFPLFLDQRPHVGDDYVSRVESVAKRLREYVPRTEFYLCTIAMGNIMGVIRDKCPASLRCVVCKRMMVRIGCRVAEMEKVLGLVTGESLGQVASQTLPNLRLIDDVASLPVYRPLIGMDKEESVNLAREIGTYELSTRRVHGCSVVPPRPATRAKVEEVVEAESRMGVEALVEGAVSSLKKTPL